MTKAPGCANPKGREGGKKQAKAGLEEEKIILGWQINFCCLIISLPDYKFIAWTDSIKEILS
jgi:hypothetical protein